MYNLLVQSLKNKILFYSILFGLIASAIVVFCCTFFIPKQEPLSFVCEDRVEIQTEEEYSLNISCTLEDIEISLVSSNEDYVKIQNSKLLGVKEGSAIVKVSVKQNGNISSKNVVVVVKKKITSLDVTFSNPTALYLLDKNIKKANDDGYFSFTNYICDYDVETFLSNNNILKIENKKITALSEGKVNLIFSLKENHDISETYEIEVKKFSPSVVFEESSVAIKKNESVSVNFSLSPSYYYGEANLSFQVKNDTVCEITKTLSSSITIKGKNYGETDIDVYINSQYAGKINISVNVDGVLEEKNDKIYHYVISSVQDCDIEENQITITGESPTFRIQILDEDNNVEYDIGTPIIDNNVLTTVLGGNYLINENLTTSTTISFNKINLEITLNIISR